MPMQDLKSMFGPIAVSGAILVCGMTAYDKLSSHPAQDALVAGEAAATQQLAADHVTRTADEKQAAEIRALTSADINYASNILLQLKAKHPEFKYAIQHDRLDTKITTNIPITGDRSIGTVEQSCMNVTYESYDAKKRQVIFRIGSDDDVEYGDIKTAMIEAVKLTTLRVGPKALERIYTGTPNPRTCAL